MNYYHSDQHHYDGASYAKMSRLMEHGPVDFQVSSNRTHPSMGIPSFVPSMAPTMAPPSDFIPFAQSRGHMPTNQSRGYVPYAPYAQSISPSRGGPMPFSPSRSGYAPIAPLGGTNSSRDEAVPISPSRGSMYTASSSGPVPIAQSRESMPIAPSRESMPITPSRESMQIAPRESMQIAPRESMHAASSSEPVPIAPSSGYMPIAPRGGHVPIAPSRGSMHTDSSSGSVPIASVSGYVPIAPRGGPVPIAPSRGPMHTDSSSGSVPIASVSGYVPIAPRGGPVPISSRDGPVPIAPSRQIMPSAFSSGLVPIAPRGSMPIASSSGGLQHIAPASASGPSLSTPTSKPKPKVAKPSVPKPVVPPPKPGPRSKESGIVTQNLRKCHHAIELEKRVSAPLAVERMRGCPVFHLEDSILNVASSNEVHGVFYLSLLRIDGVLQARFFEFGSFDGFFRGKICPKLAEAGDVLFPWAVYTKDDVKQNTIHAYPEGINGDGVRFLCKRNLIDNRKSVNNSYSEIVKFFENFDIQLVQLLVGVTRKQNRNRKTRKEKYYRYHGPGEHEYWWNELIAFQKSEQVGGIPLPDMKEPLGEQVDVLDQCSYISSLPNYHHWRWNHHDKKACVRHEQRFSISGSRIPNSPRNRILRMYRSGKDEEKILDVVEKIIEACTTINPPGYIPPPIEYPPWKIVTKEDLVIPLDINMSNQHPMSQYKYYCWKVMKQGVCSWRVKESWREVLVMNAYDPTSGNVDLNDFLHVTLLKKVNGDHIISCECPASTRTLPSDQEDCAEPTPCLHAQLLKNIMAGNTTFLNQKVLEKGLSHVTQKVLLLERKGKPDKLEKPDKPQRYSVVAEDYPEIVSVDVESKTFQRTISCHSRRCSINRGNTRVYEKLFVDTNFCDHLKEFCIYRGIPLIRNYGESSIDEDSDSTQNNDKWHGLFDAITGKWLFHVDTPSRYVKVKLSEEIMRELNFNVQRRNRIQQFDEETWPEFYPDTEGDCYCGDDWEKGQKVFSERTTLYLQQFSITPKVYSRLCVNKKCIKEWSGEAEMIFRLTRYTCSGWEIGYNFVEDVNTNACTFPGYVYKKNFTYKMSSIRHSFMSTPMFANWWFAWASASMDIDLDQPCQSCCLDYMMEVVCNDGKAGESSEVENILHKCYHNPLDSIVDKDLAVKTTNTPACNVFLQKIRNNCKLMSRVHSDFYMHFFTNLWHLRNNLRSQQHLKIIADGLI